MGNRLTETELEKIVRIGCACIDQAVEQVCAKHKAPQIRRLPAWAATEMLKRFFESENPFFSRPLFWGVDPAAGPDEGRTVIFRRPSIFSDRVS